MKTKFEENLESVMGLEESNTSIVESMDQGKEIEVLEPEKKEKKNPDVEHDYTTARENLRDIVSSGAEALADLMNLARSSESARAYEVLASFMKTLTDANKDLLDIQKKVKDLRETDKKDNPQNVTNALFVGSTNDILKQILNKPEDN